MDKIYKQIDGTRHTPEGKLYNNMMSRVRLGNLETNSKTYKTYHGISVGDNFKDFQFFAKWCNNQVGFNSIDDNGRKFCLDKDLLLYNNKEYNENYCVFVPSEINTFISKGGNHNKDNGLPIGVSYREDRGYMVYVSMPWKKNQKKCGPYRKLERAVIKYIELKKWVANVLAEKWKDKIDSRVYDVLVNFDLKERGYLLHISD